MKIVTSIDTSGLNEKIRAIRENCKGVKLGEIVLQEGKKYQEEVIKKAYPRNVQFTEKAIERKMRAAFIVVNKPFFSLKTRRRIKPASTISNKTYRAWRRGQLRRGFWMAVTKQAFARRFKQSKHMIGLLRAGFAANPSVTKPKEPKEVARQPVNKRWGAVTFKKSLFGATLTISNQTPYLAIPRVFNSTKRIADLAIKGREKALLGTINRLKKGLAVKGYNA